jgi:hypothetical protein
MPDMVAWYLAVGKPVNKIGNEDGEGERTVSRRVLVYRKPQWRTIARSTLVK